MLRVYKDFLRRVFVVLIHYREMGYTYANANATVYENLFSRNEWRGGKPSENDKLHRSLRFLESGEYNNGTIPSLTELIDQIAKQLDGEGTSNDRDLIDTIVKLLGLPYCRNVLGGSNLNNLREALLIPEEISAFKAEISKEMFCGTCGHHFEMGEMTTFTTNGRGPGGIFVCTRCRIPTSVASSNDPQGHLSVEDIKGLNAILRKKHLTAEPVDAARLAEELLAAPQAEVRIPRANYDALARERQRAEVVARDRPRGQAVAYQNVPWNVPAIPAAANQAAPRAMDYIRYFDARIGAAVAPQAGEWEVIQQQEAAPPLDIPAPLFIEEDDDGPR